MNVRSFGEADNIPLKNETWHFVPGTKNTRIYPLMRKPDITCSNVFILDIGGYPVLIDTGASQELMKTICEVLSDVPIDAEKPFLIIFGHAHFDHIYQGIVDRRLEKFGKPVYVCHTSGADILKSGNQICTQAELVGLPIPAMNIDISLFHPERAGERNLKEIFPGISLESEQCQISDTISLMCERMIFPDGQSLVFWEVPGHSDDSMAIQAGKLIHVGDIPFATGPGVAGIHGWSPVDLQKSLEKLTWILHKEEISIICPGHGKALTPDMMYQILKHLQHDLDNLPEMITFDKSRVNFSFRHAMDLIEEAHRLFPVLAGRIMMLRYRLEELGESEIARELDKIIPDEEIDRILDDFHSYFTDFQEGNRVEMQVILKALQTLQKIRSFLPRHNMEYFIDPVLLRRCVRLFSDLLITIQGSIPTAHISYCNPLEIIHILKSQQSSFQNSDDEILAATEDEEAFRQALLRRLADFQNHSDLQIDIKVLSDSPFVYADSERLSDFLSALFDYYTTYGAEIVQIAIRQHYSQVSIKISPRGSCWDPRLPLSRALLRTIQYAGGEITKMPSKNSDEIILDFPREKPNSIKPY